MIDLSIIIVNYNGEKLLRECLYSVYENTKKLSFEVIMVDNNSTDNSVQLVSREFPEVKIIRSKENLGFSRGNNKGLDIYQGRYALLLNTDTVVKDRALDKLVEFMDRNIKAGACGPKLLNQDGTPQHQGGLFNRRFWLAKRPVMVDYVLGAALLVRREVIDRVGGLDENFFFSNDDLDWCRRIRKAGWQIYFVPDAEVIHYGGYTTKKFNQKIFVEGFRGGLYFCRKHYGNFVYQIYRLLLVLAMLLALFFSLLLYPIADKRRLAAYFQVLLIALKGALLPPYAEK
ncbi:MAG: glycosyltransferase family 2 protein [Candidatus Margulisbacteria bacterium]|nr:glycosyltransferase family 2 protein [Candidatus Margulisiibacteriota bacterium]